LKHLSILVLAVGVAVAATPASFAATTHADQAADARFYASLKKLAPETRLDQICDYEAMVRIARDRTPYHPDRAQADAVSPSKHTETSVRATGGAFRSGGHWYSLSYACTTTPDNMKVTSFSYQIGKQIPESEWQRYGLWR
jgi:Domain of Unknown Function (DUF930)